MYKNENEETKMLPLNLQFFAEDDDAKDDDLDADKDGENKADKNDAKDKDKDKDNKDADSTKGKVFTQEQVSKMMAREKNQGRAAVLKELGIDPKDTKAMNMVKALLDSQKSEEQKNAEKQAEEDSKVKEAEQRAMVAEAKAEAMMLGVKSQYVDDVVALALSKMTEDSELKTIIGEFKTKYAVWFEKDDEDKSDKTGQRGTGSSVKKSDQKKGDNKQGMGARLAAQRKGSTKKTSYWS